MLALCRTGRPTEALAAYEAARHRIADSMGADPGPALCSLHERVLRQDPTLLPLPPVPEAVGTVCCATPSAHRTHSPAR
jgi:hypothetical protein